MLHYYLTADETSKTAVIKLAEWIANFYEGSGTAFEFLLSVKNSDIPGLKNKLNRKMDRRVSAEKNIRGISTMCT